MKVLCVNNHLDYINLGILDAMCDYGYSVKILPLSQFSKLQQYFILEKTLKEFKPDYIFTPGWSINLFDTDQFINIVKRAGIPHIYWATEDPLHFDEVSMVFAPHSNYVFTTAEECNEKYRSINIPSSTLLFGFNPKIFHKKPPKKEYKHDIVLIANNYYWFSENKNFRKKAINDILLPLIEANYDVKIWGDKWCDPTYGYNIDPKYCCGYLFDYQETANIYSSAKIVLGIESVNTSLTQTSVRAYEIMGCKSFHLTCYTPAHEKLFNNHEHLVWSKSPEETLSLVKYYLEHDNEREAIANNGYKEVLSKHTYYHRLNQLQYDLEKSFHI